ncbi:hypothetical protein [Vreelandella massiliensis]|uniref:hypothetical protein n=1 Tax=Vreelandella massiliensis TaxID=1816686 RepID=UPI001181C0FC|nr:hypothetical protein [Halomonas massiliensis]
MGSQCIDSVVLVSLLLALASPALALNWEEEPISGTINLSANFYPDPHATALVAGGSRSASEVGSHCRGYVSNSPDLDLNYQAGDHMLSIFAESQDDITLVVFDAAGNWHCNDDFSGTNPALQWQNPPSGNYNIWLGNYVASGDYLQSTLYISERTPDFDISSAAADSIEWGDNTSRWANDGECDDPRFDGPGVNSNNVSEDRYHDANDCRILHEQGQIYLR